MKALKSGLGTALRATIAYCGGVRGHRRQWRNVAYHQQQRADAQKRDDPRQTRQRGEVDDKELDDGGGKQDQDGELAPFRFDARNHRPPTDPVNAMLSLAYAMLTRHLTITLASVGFDPYRGFYHAPRYGRPALALDVMEPFRPVIADSVVLSVINTGEVGPNDFVVGVTGTGLTQSVTRDALPFQLEADSPLVRLIGRAILAVIVGVEAEVVGKTERGRRACIRAHASGQRAARSARRVASASAMPSSMLVAKRSVPVAGITSTWNAMPERSSTVESDAKGEFTHSSWPIAGPDGGVWSGTGGSLIPC